jgi:predicted RNase H-like HicB family nuclease
MVPALPGCFSAGNTFEMVQDNVKEAIELHIQGMLQDEEELPTEGDFILAQVDVDVKAKVG